MTLSLSPSTGPRVHHLQDCGILYNPSTKRTEKNTRSSMRPMSELRPNVKLRAKLNRRSWILLVDENLVVGIPVGVDTIPHREIE